MIPNNGGYTGYVKPVQPVKQPSPLALAASGQPSPVNPFGFQTARNTTGYQPPVQAPVRSAATSPIVNRTPAAPVAGVNPSAVQAAAALPPHPGGYDINTDPTLQGITALTGMSDQQANASALQQRQHLLEAYGDPALARAALGDENVASVAAGNPTSTLAQLSQQHTRNLHDLTEGLNNSNLLYSGYRVTQEQQAAQDYQNQLAQAAASVNGSLDTVSGNLAAALGQNQQQRVQAENDAANRALQAALAAGVAGGTGGASSGGGQVVPPADATQVPTVTSPIVDAAGAQSGQSIAHLFQPPTAQNTDTNPADYSTVGATAPIHEPLLSGSFNLRDLMSAAPGGGSPLGGGDFVVPSLATAASFGSAQQRKRQAL